MNKKKFSGVRKRAKFLLKSYKSGDKEGIFFAVDNDIEEPMNLTKFQNAIAINKGFKSWKDMVEDEKREK